MNPESETSPESAVEKAKEALRQGNRRLARQWAEKAASLNPNLEGPWLVLAAVSEPETSLRYLKRVLEINPNSQAAREGMHWAAQRLREKQKQAGSPPRLVQVQPRTLPAYNLETRRRPHFPWAWLVGLLVLTLAFGLSSPQIGQAITNISRQDTPRVVAKVEKITLTPTPTLSPTPTPTPTETLTPTPTETPTPTDTPTLTDTPTPTDTPSPTPTNTLELPEELPVEEISEGQHWIDVDLSDQRAYAYSGYDLVNSFTVSTGTWAHPTVEGMFHIYVKYASADMSGPGYYLPDVPYVMYFYDGYGLHGTYWHNNFGTPMSHGCVNFRTEDAEWVYDFTEVGTLVSVHQ